MEQVCREVNAYACILFLVKYGKANGGLLISSILKYAKRSNNMRQNLIEWLEWKEINAINFGGKPVFINGISGIKPHFIFEYDWKGIVGWREIFQFVINLEREKNS